MVVKRQKIELIGSLFCRVTTARPAKTARSASQSYVPTAGMMQPQPPDQNRPVRAPSKTGRGKTRFFVAKDQPRFKIAKILSGGQTGADRAAFDWAIANRVPHGGWCPRGRLAEDGIIPDFYKVQETVSTEYVVRTERNIRESDGTVIFTIGKTLSGGSKDTAAIATRLKKPWMHLAKTEALDPPAELRLFIEAHAIKVLNVAGSRASKEPLVADFVKATLRAALSDTDRAGARRESPTELRKRRP